MVTAPLEIAFKDVDLSLSIRTLPSDAFLSILNFEVIENIGESRVFKEIWNVIEVIENFCFS